MSLETLLAGYVLAVLAGIGAVALHSELRRRRFEPTPTEDRIFRCGRCGFVYTDDPDVDRSRCPQCGQMNEPFKF